MVGRAGLLWVRRRHPHLLAQLPSARACDEHWQGGRADGRIQRSCDTRARLGATTEQSAELNFAEVFPHYPLRGGTAPPYKVLYHEEKETLTAATYTTICERKKFIKSSKKSRNVSLPQFIQWKTEKYVKCLGFVERVQALWAWSHPRMGHM